MYQNVCTRQPNGACQVQGAPLKVDNSRQGRFGGVSVTFSLCYYTKGTICMTYIAKYLIKCPYYYIGN